VFELALAVFESCTNALRDDPCCPITFSGSREVVCIGLSASVIVPGIVLRLAVLEYVEYLGFYLL
jgi:hypothetical protein